MCGVRCPAYWFIPHPIEGIYIYSSTLQSLFFPNSVYWCYSTLFSISATVWHFIIFHSVNWSRRCCCGVLRNTRTHIGQHSGSMPQVHYTQTCANKFVPTQRHHVHRFYTPRWQLWYVCLVKCVLCTWKIKAWQNMSLKNKIYLSNMSTNALSRRIFQKDLEFSKGNKFQLQSR